MKFEFPVKCNIEIGGVLIGVAYGSCSLDELERLQQISTELKINDYKKEVLKIFADRIPDSPLESIDFRKIPSVFIEAAYIICEKEIYCWQEPIEATEEPAQKKPPTGTESIIDSTNTIPISGIDIDLEVPQST